MEKIVCQKELGLESCFETEEAREEYVRCVSKETKEAFRRFLVEEALLPQNYPLLIEYANLLVRLSAKLYCPFYIKYCSDVKRFCFGIKLDYLHIDPSEEEWQKIFATGTVEIEAESEEAFCLEYSVEAVKEGCCFIFTR